MYKITRFDYIAETNAKYVLERPEEVLEFNTHSKIIVVCIHHVCIQCHVYKIFKTIFIKQNTQCHYETVINLTP